MAQAMAKKAERDAALDAGGKAVAKVMLTEVIRVDKPSSQNPARKLTTIHCRTEDGETLKLETWVGGLGQQAANLEHCAAFVEYFVKERNGYRDLVLNNIKEAGGFVPAVDQIPVSHTITDQKVDRGEQADSTMQANRSHSESSSHSSKDEQIARMSAAKLLGAVPAELAGGDWDLFLARCDVLSTYFLEGSTAARELVMGLDVIETTDEPAEGAWRLGLDDEF